MFFIGGYQMGYIKYFDDFIDNKLLSLHTAYLAKVLSVKGKTAKIQPLGMTKETGEKAMKQSVLTAVPFTKQVKDLAKGDIAVVICCERNITEAKKGKNVCPPSGHHNMSDSVIIGVL